MRYRSTILLLTKVLTLKLGLSLPRLDLNITIAPLLLPGLLSYPYLKLGLRPTSKMGSLTATVDLFLSLETRR